MPYTVEYVRIEIRKHGNTYRSRTIVEREREPLLNASKKAKCAQLLLVVVVVVGGGSVKCRGIIVIIVIGRSLIFHSCEC